MTWKAIKRWREEKRGEGNGMEKGVLCTWANSTQGMEATFMYCKHTNNRDIKQTQICKRTLLTSVKIQANKLVWVSAQK